MAGFDVDSSLKRMAELVDEFSSYSEYRELLKKTVKKIEAQYIKKQINYEKYIHLLDKVLEGKTKESALKSYNSYLLEILGQLEYYNSIIFYHFYKDTSYAELRLKKAEEIEAEAKEEAEAEKKAAKEIAAKAAKEKSITPKIRVKEPAEIEEIRKAILRAREEEEGITEEAEAMAARLRLKEKEAAELAEAAEKEKLFETPVRKGFLGNIKAGLTNLAARLTALAAKLGLAKKEEKKKEKVIGFERIRLKKGMVIKEPEVKRTLLGLGTPEAILEEEATRINPYLLAQEAKRIKAILTKQRGVRVYRPSTLGALANHLTRRISIYLLDNFPDFFRYLYNAIKSANMQVLSNTYLNIMVLVTLLSFLASSIFFSYLFYIKAFSLLLIIFNTVFISVLVSISVFGIMYAYPFMLIKSRRRSVNANLPFAINHMSAVAGAGVPPSAMFRLIAETEEYEEVSKEIEKIVELIEVFGYDLTTAVRAVAATTPSPTLKEFFDGMVSAIETGADLKQYLKQKAEEAMLTYSLEREKYLETISTYSDIYTGILIAAPLFFVVALSLVSILGGSIAGIDVNSLVVLGTYAIIPLINIFFLLFLEGTQPEV